jgi:hypothetical protein
MRRAQAKGERSAPFVAFGALGLACAMRLLRNLKKECTLFSFVTQYECQQGKLIGALK